MPDDVIEVEAKTLEDAVAEALARLGARRDEVEIETLDEGRSGFLGIGSAPARVRVRRTVDPTATVIEALRDILAACEIPGGVTGAWDEAYGGVRLDLDVSEEDTAILVGRRGQTLNALQFLTSVVAGRRIGSRVRVALDIDGFRDRRAESLEGLARRAAREARRAGRPVDLDPMPPQDRRIVHMYLADEEGIETYSEGQGNRRHVVIAPTGAGEGQAGGAGEEASEGRERLGEGERGRGRRGGRRGRGRARGRRAEASEGGRRSSGRGRGQGGAPRGRSDERLLDDDFVPPTDAAMEWVKRKA